MPFPDNYTASEICMKERCHAHIRVVKVKVILQGSEWEEKTKSWVGSERGKNRMLQHYKK